MRHVGADQATFVDATVIVLKRLTRFEPCGQHMTDKQASATLLCEISGHDSLSGWGATDGVLIECTLSGTLLSKPSSGAVVDRLVIGDDACHLRQAIEARWAATSATTSKTDARSERSTPHPLGSVAPATRPTTMRAASAMRRERRWVGA